MNTSAENPATSPDADLAVLQAIDLRRRFLDDCDRSGFYRDRVATRGTELVNEMADFDRAGFCRTGFRWLFGKTPTQAEQRSHSRRIGRLEKAGLIEREVGRLANVTNAGRQLLASS